MRHCPNRCATISGQQLRGVLPVGPDKPRFLGDDPVPEVFEPQIRRLETRLKTHEEGTGAVGQALDQILDALGVKPEDGRQARR